MMLRTIVKWSVRNSPAVNTIMIAVLVVGISSLALMRRETFPQFQLDIVIATVPYPGATPDEVEQSICQKIEESVRSVEGVKKVTSVSSEGSGSVIIELNAGANAQRALSEIRSEIDRIPSFPQDAEDPEVRQITMRSPAVRVAVIGGEPGNEHDEWQLRALTEQIRDEILNLPNVSQVMLMGARPYQIDIEIPEEKLREHNLTLAQVAAAVREQNNETALGNMKSAAGEFLVSADNKRKTGRAIKDLVVVKGTNLTIGDLFGEPRDGFQDALMYNRVDGKQALTLEIQTTSEEDILKVAKAVEDYTNQKQAEMPEGYRLQRWNDASAIVQDRLSMLTRNGISGLILVFIVLSLFLNIRLAFWVALGIPISIFGACSIMLGAGDTLNMLTMFSFVMGLGIVVDDAIVIGENIYTHREKGKSGIKAAIDGTIEVAPSVICSVLTTVIAFMPLFFVTGMMGKFISVMPLALIAMLLISLFESLVILPCHLRHRPGEHKGEKKGLIARVLGWFFSPFVRFVAVVPPLRWTRDRAASLLAYFDYPRRYTSIALQRIINNFYIPTLRWTLDRPVIVYSLAGTSLLLMAGLIAGGFTPVQIAPDIDGDIISVRVRFPAGTLGHVTERATADLEQSLREVLAEMEQEQDQRGADEDSLSTLIYRSVGSSSNPQPGAFQNASEHFGEVWVELKKVEHRGDITSEEIINRWREHHNNNRPTVGAESITFVNPQMMPSGNGIEFRVQGQDMAVIQAAVEDAKARLASYDGVYDVEDNDDPGKSEVSIRVKPEAHSLGISQQDLARTVRAALYGEEVMRLQRGRNEVKLMVRYPPEERITASFDNIRIRTENGDEVQLAAVAEKEFGYGYAAINRVDQQRAITVTADIDTSKANAEIIAGQLKQHFDSPEFKQQFPGITTSWGGAQEQFRESMMSLMMGTVVCLFGMYLLLTIEFRSYTQPAIILAIIPFGLIGAVLGHLLLGMTLSLFSFFGIVALMGVLANDSIVLVDFINARRRSGMSLRQSLVDAGRYRFRAVVLTSLTTVAGLMPILWEQSLQAQVVQPMAAALAYGLMLATVWVLLLVPTLYQTFARHMSGSAESAEFSSGKDAFELYEQEEQRLAQQAASPQHADEQSPFADQITDSAAEADWADVSANGPTNGEESTEKTLPYTQAATHGNGADEFDSDIPTARNKENGAESTDGNGHPQLAPRDNGNGVPQHPASRGIEETEIDELNES